MVGRTCENKKNFWKSMSLNIQENELINSQGSQRIYTIDTLLLYRKVNIIYMMQLIYLVGVRKDIESER